MTLAIERVHNLPPHLSYVSTLPDITQILNRDIDELKQRLKIDYFRVGTVFPRALSTKPLTSGKHGCVHM